MTELFDQTVIDHEPSQQITVADSPDSMTPLALIRQAVGMGLGPEQLKALVDLQEQVRGSRAREEFAAAMVACQEELPLIVKDKENNQTKAKYARMETVQLQAKPVLSKHGLSLSFSEADCPTPGSKRIVCTVRHRAGHSEQHFMDLPLDGFSANGKPIGAMNPVQAAASTGTYAQRYLTCRIFNITIADTDRDGRDVHANPEANPAAPKADPRGKRQPPAATGQPQTPNANGIHYADVCEIWNQWKKDNPSGTRTEFGDWTAQTSGRDFRAEFIGWTASDLSKCQEALGLENTSGIPF